MVVNRRKKGSNRMMGLEELRAGEGGPHRNKGLINQAPHHGGGGGKSRDNPSQRGYCQECDF